MVGDVGAAIRAACGVARDHGVRCDRPTLLRDGGANLVVHLSPSPVVARIAWLTAQVRSQPARSLTTEVELCRWGLGRGAAVRPLAVGRLGDVHVREGLVMSFWQYLPEVSATDDPGVLGRELATLHGVLAGYPGQLPGPEWIAADAHRTASLLARLGLVRTDEVTGLLDDAAAVVQEIREVTADRLAGRRPGVVQPLHGDPHGRNTADRDGRLLWLDLEDTWFGPAEFDLVVASGGVEGGPLVDAYVAAGGSEPDSQVLALCQRLRELQVVTWSLLLAASRGTGWELARERLGRWNG